MMPRRTICLFVAILICSTNAFAGILTIYAIPSPKGIDWTSPKSLAWSAISNQISDKTHTIGHANIHLRCRVEEGDAENFEILTGMTSADNDPTNDRIKHEGYGLGVLFATVPGRLETHDEASRDLHSRFKRGLVNFMQFQIGAPTCSRLAQYANEYQERGYDQFYGLPNRPRHGEGAGCTAFAASFLDLAGVHAGYLKANWSKTRRVPENLVGGPLTGNFVPVQSLLRPLRPSRWATPDETQFTINFFDPDALFQHIESAWKAGLNPLGAGTDQTPAIPAQMSNIAQAKGFILNANLIHAPTEPIWLN